MDQLWYKKSYTFTSIFVQELEYDRSNRQSTNEAMKAAIKLQTSPTNRLESRRNEEKCIIAYAENFKKSRTARQIAK